MPQVCDGPERKDARYGTWTENLRDTGCSLNIVFFSKKIQYFAFLSPALGCHWLYGKWPANRSDCTHRSQIRHELLSYMQGMGCSELGKHTIFNKHPVQKPCLYINTKF